MKPTKEEIKALRKENKRRKEICDNYTRAAFKVENTHDGRVQRCSKCNTPIAWEGIGLLHDCNASTSCFAAYRDALLILDGVYQPPLFELRTPHPIAAIEAESWLTR